MAPATDTSDSAVQSDGKKSEDNDWHDACFAMSIQAIGTILL